MKNLLASLGITEVQLKRMLGGKRRRPKIIKRHITEHTFEFGVVSDTHLCSIEEKLNELHTFYAICKKEGITEVFNAGDVLAGWKIYRGQENEVHTFGADGQSKYVIDHYPKVDGIDTYFICGNHDDAWFKLAGVDVGETISSKRKDMHYLGRYQGDIVLNGVKIRLIHPDGNAYALSYKPQKIAEQILSGQKPQVLLVGHYHSAIYFHYRNIHIMTCGCFEGQTSFLLRKGISPQVGGWIVKVRMADDTHKSIVSCTTTWIPFY